MRCVEIASANVIPPRQTVSRTVRTFYEEAFWNDLNEWLKVYEPRIEFRFPPPVGKTEAKANAASVSRQRHQKNEIRRMDELGHSATALPGQTSEKPGAKSKIRASLASVLEGWFDKPLNDLPKKLRRRVQQEFFPAPWDDLTEDQRRIVAQQRDYQNDPAMEPDREFWWNFFARKNDLERQIKEWQATATPTASDRAKQEERLAELEKELARMERQERLVLNGNHPGKSVDRGERDDSAISTLPEGFIAYPKAIKLLADRIGATREELAAWVWVGPDNGGLAAYLNAIEDNPPPRFYFDYHPGMADNFDYLSPLMACWFREDDLSSFEPTDRYITGKELIERWSKQPGIEPAAFIRAKISESRLQDIHPIFGVTQGTNGEDGSYPPLESGLFARSEIEKVEAIDFACPGGEGPAKSVEIGTPQWRAQTARKAANARHNRPGGSRDKQQQMCDKWATGKYSSRDRCAEEEYAALGMSYSAARKALRNTPDP